MKHMMLAFSMLFVLILLVVFPEIASSSVIQAMKLCALSIVPTLFPFLIATNLWIRSGFAQHISTMLSLPVKKLFHLPEEAAPALLFGCLSGFPVGAKTAVTLYTDGHLQKNETEQVMLFCNNAGPAFILGIIGNGIFHSRRVGAALWLIHIISAMIVGILFRSKRTAPPSPKTNEENHILIRSSIVTQSILDAGSTIFQISIYVAAFSVVIGFLTAALPPVLSNASYYPLISGILEISSGISLLKTLKPTIAFLLSSVLLGWNGCCIHFQVLALTMDTDLRLHKYLLGKVIHAAISLLLAYIAIPLLF